MKISVVIPTYEMYGQGSVYLSKLLETIFNQTYTNYEIIVSDHSQNDIIKNFVENYPIRYFKNERGRGNSSINMNEGIKKSTGDIIKIIHMDDFISNENMFQLIVDSFKNNPDKKWGGVAFNHFDQDNNVTDNVIYPDEKGPNGCPSVSFFINDNNYFDENLININDGEMYRYLYKKYGSAITINEVCITIRRHRDSVTNRVINSEIEQRERDYYNRNLR